MNWKTSSYNRYSYIFIPICFCHLCKSSLYLLMKSYCYQVYTMKGFCFIILFSCLVFFFFLLLFILCDVILVNLTLTLSISIPNNDFYGTTIAIRFIPQLSSCIVAFFYTFCHDSFLRMPTIYNIIHLRTKDSKKILLLLFLLKFRKLIRYYYFY